MRLSPSTIDTSRRGTPKRRAIAVAAMGSVGETIAPSTNAELQERPSIAACATAATTTVVTITSPTESRPIGRMFSFSSCSDVKNVPAYSSGGSTATSTRSGGSSSSGMPGRKPTATPPITSTIGYGTRSVGAMMSMAGDGHEQHEEDD